MIDLTRSHLLQGDCLEKMKDIPDNSVDLVCSDPPYRYGFMGKKWDSKQDFTDIWRECYRVLKPGGFAFIMNAPRSDCQLLLLKELGEVGFNLEITPIFWTYASGFPKAMNISKAIDKRKGLQREVVGKYEHPGRKNRSYQTTSNVFSGDRKNDKLCDAGFGYSCNQSGAFFGSPKTRKRTFAGDHEGEWDDAQIANNLTVTKPACEESQRLNGAYAGLQLKPAVEMINVVMKPLSEKTYIEQALKNGKGISWFDDCRIPYTDLTEVNRQEGGCYSRGIFSKDAMKNAKAGYCTPGDSGVYNWNSPAGKKLKKKLVGGRLTQEKRWSYGDDKVDGFKPQEFDQTEVNLKGRFPANLLVSDNMIDQGKDHNSRYFSLDAWWESHLKNLPKEQQQSFPFLIVPKASKAEKNKGLQKTKLPSKSVGEHCLQYHNGEKRDDPPQKNFHPTSKPVKLMSYLITLGSRPEDLILDPFAGSMTTGVACKLEDRKYIMIEREPEYFAIGKARMKAVKIQKKLFWNVN